MASLHSPNPSLDVDPGVNPFQVYPVAALNEVSDVLSATVETEQVRLVRDLVREYVAGFGQVSNGGSLLITARGDFGTGKTHLMQYARSLLMAEMGGAHMNAPQPVSVLAISSEASIEEWYATELGPKLIEASRPRELVRELLTELACAVAEEDPDTERLAEQFRESRRYLYARLRDPGDFDAGEVERRFSEAVADLCPQFGAGFRRTIEALRWEEKAEAIEEWLAGNDGAGSDMPPSISTVSASTRASYSVRTVASLCRRLNRPFGLFIDEFEHLARFDRREDSKRNTTWVKRLVESLARQSALVFVSGHWEAWLQQGDFLDRFVGRRPIQLVRLTPEEVLGIVRSRVGEKWSGMTTRSAEAVIEETAGNIRRVMTVLYDLWDDPKTRGGLVTREAVRAAASARLQPGTATLLLPALEMAASGQGGMLIREVKIGDVIVTAKVVKHDDVCLIVDMLHARDEISLLDQGSRFAKLVRDSRGTWPNAQGLAIVTGAVIDKHIATLDAAFPETTVINGEAEDASKLLPGIVERAFMHDVGPGPASTSMPTALEDTFVAAISRADAQSARSERILGTDERAQALVGSSNADPQELARLRVASLRKRTFDLQMEGSKRPMLVQLFEAMLRDAHAISFSFASALLFMLSIFADDIFGISVYSPLYGAMKSISIICLAFFVFVTLVFLFRNYTSIVDFNAHRVRRLTYMFEDEAEPWALDAEGEQMTEMLRTFGPRRALQKLSNRTGG